MSQIPSSIQPLIDQRNNPTVPWYRYWADLGNGGGSQGPQGAQGAAGPSGATGTQGSQGAVGSQGAQGDAGTQGAVGPMVPYFISSLETFTIPLYDQSLFAMTIDNEGIIVADGYLIEVD